MARDFGGMAEGEYVDRINTPARNQIYFDKFHQPLIGRAKGRREGQPVLLVDIACGYAHELDFFDADESLELWGLDISSQMLGEAQRRLPHVHFEVHDVRRADLPYPNGCMDVALLVNAVIYFPLAMLQTAFLSLRQDGEAVVNFRRFDNPLNRPFYDYYQSMGGTLEDAELTMGNDRIPLKVLNYARCADPLIRLLDRQVYLTDRDDIEKLLRWSGFSVRGHEAFRFGSPANSNNEVDVFTIAKDGEDGRRGV